MIPSMVNLPILTRFSAACRIKVARNINIIHFCDKNVIHFYYLPRVFGEYKLHLLCPEFHGKDGIFKPHTTQTSTSNRIIKRSFDIVVSGLACLCVLPFIPFIALIIKIQSPGPIFFKQARTGLNGDTFYCLNSVPCM